MNSASLQIWAAAGLGAYACPGGERRRCWVGPPILELVRRCRVLPCSSWWVIFGITTGAMLRCYLKAVYAFYCFCFTTLATTCLGLSWFGGLLSAWAWAELFRFGWASGPKGSFCICYYDLRSFWRSLSKSSSSPKRALVALWYGLIPPRSLRPASSWLFLACCCWVPLSLISPLFSNAGVSTPWARVRFSESSKIKFGVWI